MDGRDEVIDVGMGKVKGSHKANFPISLLHLYPNPIHKLRIGEVER